jgi:hypothetical protein
MSKNVRILNRKDINPVILDHYLRTLRLPCMPIGIIPPKIPYYDDFAHIINPPLKYYSERDYFGRNIDAIASAVERTINEWAKKDKTNFRVGIFLSGGIDSALLLKCACNVIGPERVRGYNLKFGPIQDETEYAKSVADFCNCKLIIGQPTPEELFKLTKESTFHLRAPTWCPQVRYIAHLLHNDGTKNAFIGLGLDAMTGGEVDLQQTNTNPEKFVIAETNCLELQRHFIWSNITHCHELIDLKVPYLRYSDIVAYFRRLPICHKTEGLNTKIRIREEVRHYNYLPEKNAGYGLKAGTKKGFGPDWSEFFDMGYNELTLAHDPTLKGFDMTNYEKQLKWKHNCWYKLIFSSLYYFLELLDEGAYTVEE